jgi:outer membrane protein
MIRRVLPFVLCLLAASTARAAEDDLLIGYVDLQKAIQSVEEGRRAKSKLEKTFKKKQAALSAKEEELKKLQEALEAQATVSGDSPDAQAKKKEFQTKLMELQQVYMKEQQELAKLERQELSAITEKMRTIIEQVGKAGGYSLILEVQGNRLLYAKDHMDLTNEVIRKYNAKFK